MIFKTRIRAFDSAKSGELYAMLYGDDIELCQTFHTKRYELANVKYEALYYG